MRVLITGGDQGLGAEVARQLRAPGDKIDIIPGDRILKSMVEYGSDPLVVARELIPRENYDVVINNWGVNRLAPIGKEMDDQYYDISHILNHNVGMAHAVVSELVRRGNTPAKVINVSSITHRIAQRTTAMYCASKAALVQLTRVQARELSPLGWQVNCFAPGKIADTEMSRLTDKQVLELRGWEDEDANRYALSNVPVGRFMDAKEAASNLIVLLNFTNYVNGATIDCAGGQ